MKKVIYLNAGHGGIHPTTKAYMTNPLHGKLYHFEEKGKIVYSAYEGETNRIFANLIAEAMQGTGIEIVKVYHDYLDTPNHERLYIANAHYLKNTPEKALWLSMHSNATGIQSKGASQPANGISLWTSEGKTESDKIADMLWQDIALNTASFRVQMLEQTWVDKDKDFEAQFEELIYSYMCAVLIENLFFTHLRDARMLKNPAYQKAFVQAIKTALLKYFI